MDHHHHLRYPTSLPQPTLSFSLVFHQIIFFLFTSNFVPCARCHDKTLNFKPSYHISKNTITSTKKCKSQHGA